MQPGKASSAADRLAPHLQQSRVRHQRRRWTRAVDRWDHHGVAGLEKVIDAVVATAAEGAPFELVVDVGAGTGAISLPIAVHAKRVLAVDVSAAMLERLSQRARDAGIQNIDTAATPAESLDLAAGSVDLIVSNYALHHLHDRDKAGLIHQAAVWLRPGGRIVIGDMMLGRGTDAEDRAIMADKLRLMLAKGPGGWWRIVKNALRFLTRSSERPIPIGAWTNLLQGAGLQDVRGWRIVAEAGIVVGQRPGLDKVQDSGEAQRVGTVADLDQEPSIHS